MNCLRVAVKKGLPRLIFIDCFQSACHANPTLTVALLLANSSVQNVGIRPRPLTGYFVNSRGLADEKLFRQLVGAVQPQEAYYVESWLNTTSAWASWSRFDIPKDPL
jgi:hypothetical protein